MAIRMTGQAGFADAALADVIVINETLERMSALVDWERVEVCLSSLRSSSSPGCPGFDPLVLFKSLLLAHLYGLSDRELEFMLADRLSFKRFAGFAMADKVPDHSVLCRFRGELIHRGLLDVLFEELNGQLDEAGLILRKGTLVDATLFEAAAARPEGKKGKVDKDAAFVKRSGKSGSVYGYKAHVGVDQGSGLIRRVVTTPANVNDTTPADDLVSGDERSVYGDKAYDSHARRAALKARGIKPRIMRRGNKHHELPPRLRRFNRLLRPLRAPVETTFATWKRRMGLVRGRYVGLIKTTAQILLTAIAFNLRRAAAITP